MFLKKLRRLFRKKKPVKPRIVFDIPRASSPVFCEGYDDEANVSFLNSFIY